MPRKRIGRFTHPESEVVWAAIETLDVGAQHELSQRLDTLFDGNGTPTTSHEKAAAAVAGLHRAARNLGHPPTRLEYRLLREEHPELKLPAETNVRRWLGTGGAAIEGWNECLISAGLDTVTDGDFTSALSGRTYRFDDSEIFEALREYAREPGRVLTKDAYEQWARSPEVMARPGRRPTSYHPFERLGGFRNALLLAGVITENEARYAADGRLLPLRYRYTETDMRDALLEVAKKLGRSPRSGEYERERQRIYQAVLRDKEIRPFPTAAVIRDHFGSWNAALDFADLAPVDSHIPSFTGSHRPSYTEPEMIECLRLAWVEMGEPFTGAAYKAWRENELAKGTSNVPTLDTVSRRLGGWNEACRRALPKEYRTGHGRALRR